MDFRKKNKEAKGRLAASEVHSLASQGISNASTLNHQLAIQRIEEKYGLHGPIAEWARDNMIAVLEKAEITINFRAQDFFAIPENKSYRNLFELNKGTVAYRNTRDQTEQNLFKYNAAGGNSNNRQMVDRIGKRGNFNSGSNTSFIPLVRPRYGALNIFGLPLGPSTTRMYGNSVIILKEHMKHKCTFTFGDSFNYTNTAINANSSPLANVFHLDRILVDMTDNTFGKLYKKAHNQPLAPYELNGHRYIEAQIHHEIIFNRDVKEIRISEMERRIGDNAQELAIRERIITDFCQRNNIELSFVND